VAILPIRLYPDEILRQECRPVTDFDDELRRLAADMVETMYAAPGVGLAAPQVGIDLRLAVVDVTVGEEDEALITLVNPRIVESEGRESDVEGCLSIPELTDKVVRPTWIRVEADDTDGEAIEIEAEGFVARAIYHEIDHLDGVLFVDRLNGLRRERARRHLRRLERGVVEASA
jgi:peptide deformylase